MYRLKFPVYLYLVVGLFLTVGIVKAATFPLTFTVVASNTSFVTGQTLGALRSNFTGNVGFAFTVGTAHSMSVSSLCRWVVAGNTQTHLVRLFASSGATALASATVSTAGKGVGFTCASVTPVTLNPGSTYVMLSAETDGGDQWYHADTTLTTTTDAAVTDGAFNSGGGAPFSAAALGANHSYGPVNFFYTPVTVTPVISSINLSGGNNFAIPANAGSNIDTLSATCSAGSCSGATFQLATNAGCTSTNNSSFAVSGNNLNIGGTTINDTNSRSICLEAQVAGASNRFQSFALAGTAGPAACATPPAPAQRAGFTTLVYCGDFSQPKYANLSNWLDCTGNGSDGPFEFSLWFGYGCDSSHIRQEVDPVTGHTVLHFTWYASDLDNISRLSLSNVAFHQPNSGFGWDVPSGHYVQMTGRFVGSPYDYTADGSPAPDFFEWMTCQQWDSSAGNNTDCPGPVTAWEQDIIELYGFQGATSGAPKWTADNWPSNWHWQGPISGTLQQVVPGWDFSTPSTIAHLQTNNGNYSNPAYQTCEYLKNNSGVMTLIPVGSGGENCWTRTNGNTGCFACADEVIGGPGPNRFGTFVAAGTNNGNSNGRNTVGWWLGWHAAQQDWYIENVQAWSCANYKTDNTCVGNGLTQ